jgi:phage gpG-like protein
MIQIEFSPWGTFHARKRPQEIRRWLRAVADASEKVFKKMSKYPPASTPGQFPAVRTGRLRASIRTVVSDKSMTIGTSMPYSIFLRMGTSKMARRKMSDDALKEGMHAGRLGHWVEWSRL